MGRLALLVSSLLVVVLVAVACADNSDDPNRVLELGAGSISEQQLRSSFRALQRNDPREMEKLCDQILLEQIGDVAILETLGELGLVLATVTLAAPAPTDITRAAEVVIEECARIRNE